MATVAEYLIAYLAHLGVKHAFGLSGANIEDVFDQVSAINSPIKLILAKDEASAGSMADGYSRLSNKLGVVFTTSGGGALNLATSLGEAFTSQKPILAILGMTSTLQEGQGGFQDLSGKNHTLDGEALFARLASKYFYRFSSEAEMESFPDKLALAVTKALTPPFGTSILMIPKDLQLTIIKDFSLSLPANTIAPMEVKKSLDEPIFDESWMRQCWQARSHTLLILGEQIQALGLEEEINTLIERLDAYVALTPEAKSVYSHKNRRFAGITGSLGHSSVLQVAKSVELVFLIGTRFQHMSRVGLEEIFKEKPIIYLNNCSPSYGLLLSGHESEAKERHLVCIGDLSLMLNKLQSMLPSYSPRKELGIKVAYQKPCFFPEAKTSNFNFATICALFNQYIDDSDVIFADAGNTGGAAVHYLKGAHYFGIALGMGAMGYAFGASIGAYYATQRVCWCFVGDGSLFMQGLEIHTAIENKLPIRFIVLNNNSHAMCYTRERLFLNHTSPLNCFKKSFLGVGFANMFPGFYSQDIDNLEDLERHLKCIKDRSEPILLSLNVDYQELPPFLPFIRAFRG